LLASIKQRAEKLGIETEGKPIEELLSEIIEHDVEEHKKEMKTIPIKAFKSKPTVILFLYLLHHPDNARNIAQCIDKIKEETLQTLKIRELVHENKVSQHLNRVRQEGVITLASPEKSKEMNVKKKKGKRGGNPGKYYEANPMVLSIFPFMFLPVDAEHIVKIIQSVSPDKKRCAEMICSFKQYDYLTILLHVQQLLNDISMYVGVANLADIDLEQVRKKILEKSPLKLSRLDEQEISTEWLGFICDILNDAFRKYIHSEWRGWQLDVSNRIPLDDSMIKR